MNGELSHSTNGNRSPNFQPGNLPLPAPDVVLLHPATQRNGEQQEYKLRLLNLFIDEVKRTGLIDYPELVQFLERVFEVDNAPPGAVLMPAAIEALVANLQAAQADIHVTSVQIKNILGQLEDAISDRTLSKSQEIEFDDRIRQGSQRFLKAVEYLVDSAERYVYAPQMRSQQVGKESVSVEDVDSEWIRKLMNDLKYIRQYIAEHAQFKVIKSEFHIGDSQKSYFRRLYKYLEIAPGLADILGNLVQNVVEHKIAGGEKLVSPKPY